jgi:diphthamide biosynthesis methyltransferase
MKDGRFFFMGRLSFVGLGLGPRGISLEGLDELRSADIVYLEYYTSPHEPKLLKELREINEDRDFADHISVAGQSTLVPTR